MIKISNEFLKIEKYFLNMKLNYRKNLKLFLIFGNEKRSNKV
jgi:hypothetical protein